MYSNKTDESYPPPATAVAGFPVTTTTQAYTPTAFGAYEIHPPQATGPWSTGLCDCFDDVGNCCVTCFCPCITFGQVAEIVDRGSTSCGTSGALYALIMFVTGCACVYSCFYRSKMRGQYALQDSPCNDCLVHWFCEPCALCQEYRELKRRGFDMTTGWQFNVEKQAQGATEPPAVEDGMSR